MKELKDGVYYDMPIDEYHNATGVMSKTSIAEFVKSPSHYLHWLANRETFERKRHFEFGNATEAFLMGRGGDEVYVVDDRDIVAQIGGKRPTATNRYRDWYDEQLTIAGNRYIINMDERTQIETIVNNATRNGLIRGYVDDGVDQLTAVWTDPETGIRLKTRPDITLTEHGIIVDIKTARDASPGKFRRHAEDYHYPLSVALMVEGLLHHGVIESLTAFQFIVIEKSEPFNVQLYDVSDESINMARASLRSILRRFKTWLTDGRHPVGYDIRSTNKFGVMELEFSEYYFNTL